MNPQLQSSTRLFLCGMMGTGKSSVGKKLARLLKLPFSDLDKIIEQAYSASVSELFQIHGEPYFREIEKKALSDFIDNGLGILALGGGSLQDQEITDAVKSAGYLIFIDTPLPMLLERLQGNRRRPLLLGLTTLELEQKIRQLNSEREIFYKQADIIVEGSSRPAAETAKAILSKLQDIEST